MLKLILMLCLLLFAASTQAKSQSCAKAWNQHKSEFKSTVLNKSQIKKSASYLSDSSSKQKQVLGRVFKAMENEIELRAQLITLKERTHQLHLQFNKLSESDKGHLFGSLKRFKQLSLAKSSDELFEESLTQMSIGQRHLDSGNDRGEAVRYINSVEELQWTLFEPAKRQIKTKIMGFIQNESKEFLTKSYIGHDRRSGEFSISLCYHWSASGSQALPPQFSCSNLSLQDGLIEKGPSNFKEIADTTKIQKLIAENFMLDNDIGINCLSYFLNPKSNQKVALK